jgi:hypothetical protein
VEDMGHITQPVEDIFVLNISTVRYKPFEASTWTVPQLIEYSQSIITGDFFFSLWQNSCPTYTHTIWVLVTRTYMPARSVCLSDNTVCSGNYIASGKKLEDN